MGLSQVGYTASLNVDHTYTPAPNPTLYDTRRAILGSSPGQVHLSPSQSAIGYWGGGSQ